MPSLSQSLATALGVKKMFEEKWKEYLSEGTDHRKGKRTKQYAGSPIERDGTTKMRKDNEKRKKQRERNIPGYDLLSPRMLGEEGEDKKNCSPGNPNHRGSSSSKGKPGSFASKEEEGSWSIATDSSKAGCEKGKLQKLGGKRTRWTKAGKGKSGCGRDGQFLCSNPKVKKWASDKVVSEILVSFLDDLLEGEEGLLLDEQGSDCGTCIRNYLQSLNAAIRASKGDLIKKK